MMYVYDFFVFVFDIIVFVFELLWSFVKILMNCVTFLWDCFSALPVWLSVSGCVLIIVCVIYKFLGREGSE